MWELLVIFIILFLGSFLQGASGFGFGLFSMGLLPLFMTIKVSTLLVLALTILISFRIVWKYPKHIDWHGLPFILISAIIGRICSFYVLHTFGNMDMMKIWLGFLLIGMVIYMLKNNNPITTPYSLNRLFILFIGFTGGLIGGIFAVGGPIFVVYFLAKYKEKESYNTNLQVVFLFTNIFTVILHGLNNDFHSTFIGYLIIGMLAVLFGVYFGLKWFNRLPKEMIKRMASLIVLAAAFNLLLFS